jgi:basic membrane lipoprotein Med (substrate-binding protein (PBP1-ABC) superfamily)
MKRIGGQFRATATLSCLLLSLFAALGNSGCAQKETASNGEANNAPAARATDAPAPDAGGNDTALKVGLITPGKISDKGWNASANEGVQRVKSELGVEVSPPVEGPAPTEVEGALRNVAQQGHTLIYLHASEFDDAAKNVASSFPRTTFTVVGGRSTGANLVPIRFEAGQANYLAGMLAGGMTKTGKIGAVGAAKIPIIEQAFQSFKKGAQAVRPDVDVRIAFTGDESDPGKAKQQAQAMLGAGVDVLIHNANAGGLGVAQAVSEKPGAMFIGANADQSDLATPQNLGSFILDVPNAYLAVARSVQEGTGSGGTGQPFKAGLKEKAVGFVFNPKFAGTIPADLKAKMTSAEQAMIAGTLDPAP